MSFLQIDNTTSKNIYLEVLDDLITLISDFRDKVKKEIEYDNEF